MRTPPRNTRTSLHRKMASKISATKTLKDLKDYLACLQIGDRFFKRCSINCPSKIKWDLTNGPLSKLLELLDPPVFFGVRSFVGPTVGDFFKKIGKNLKSSKKNQRWTNDSILEPQTTIYKWLFQLDDSKSLYRKWLFHQTSIYKWLFGVPGFNFGFKSWASRRGVLPIC